MPQSQNNFSNFRFKDNSFPARARIFAFISAVIAATLFIVWAVSAANTTIGSNITTSGNLTVGGTSSLASLTLSSGLNASSTFQVSGISTFYNSIGIGSTSPSQLLSVQGNAYISGNISNVANINATGTIGVGTTSPTESISTSGRIYVGGTGTSTIENNLQVLGQIKVGTASTYINDTELSATGNFTIKTQSDSNHLVLQSLGRVGISSSTPWGVLSVERNGSNANMPILVVSEQGTSSPYFIVKDTGKVGIGTSSPSSLFSVQGNALLSGNLSLANLTATGTLTLAGDTYLANASTTGMLTVGGGFISQASSTVAGNFQVSGGLNASSTLTVASGARFYSTLQADSLSSFVGGFISSASSTIAGNFHTSGVLNASSTLLVANLSTLAGGFISQASSTINGPLQIAGNLQASSTISANNLFVAGNVGIGTTSPGNLLAIQGTGLFTGTLTAPNMIATGTLTVSGVTGTSTITSNLDVLGNLQIGSICINCGSGGGFTGGTTTVNNLIVTNFSTSTFAGGLTVQTNKFVVDNQTGNVGIGTTTPGALLAVQGAGLFTGTLTAPNIIATGTLTIAGNTTLANASTTGMLTIGNGFISQASSTISNSLQVAGLLQASSSLSVGGGTALGSTLSVTGTSTLAGLSAGFGTFSSNLATSKDLSVSGLANLTGFISSASSTISSSLHIAGNLQASSTVSLATTTITVNHASGSPAIPLTLFNTQSATNTANRLAFQISGATSTLTTSAITSQLIQNYDPGKAILAFSVLNSGLLSEAARFDSNGFLGIGTTSPSQLLSVQGNALFSGNISSVANITATGTLTVERASTTGMLTIGGGFISTASSTVAGNLHVSGVLRSSSTLTVAGAALFTSNETDGRIIQLNPLTGTNGAIMHFRNTTGNFYIGSDDSTGGDVTGVGYANAIWSVSNTPTIFGTNNSERVRITEGGNVGIGTTTPGALLAVQGAGLFTGTLTAPNIIATGTLTLSGDTYLKNASTTGMLTIGNGFISQASSTISSNLQVSGVLNASSTLTVAGASRFYSTLQADALSTLTGFISTASSTVSGNLTISGGLNASSTLTVASGARFYSTLQADSLSSFVGGFISSASSTIAGNFHTSGVLNASSTLLVANLSTLAGGFISSASSTIASSLHITGNLQASSSVSLATTTITANYASGSPAISLTLYNTQSATNTANRLAFQIGGATSTLTTSAITSQLIQNYDPGKGVLIFSTLRSGLLTEGFRLTDTGNIGIGSTSPWQHLGVSGGATESIVVSGSSSGNLYLENTGANARSWRLFSHNSVASGGFVIQDATQGLNRFTIDNSGNIGIGTTTPGAMLAVQGDALIAGTTTVRALVATSSSLTVGGSNFVVDASGNVGIGTASPGGKLDVYDSAGNNYPFNVKTNKTTGVWLARFTNGNGDGVFFTHTGSDNTQIIGSAANTVVIGADYSGGSYRDLALATNGAERMRITTGGNVGIGTTTPGQTLSVHGNALIAGTTTVNSLISTSTALLATQGGNVGIGITSPAAKLHVSGNGNNLRLSSTNDTTANYIQVMTSASAAQGYMGVEGSSAGSTLTNSLANATFLSSGASGTALQLGSAGAIRMTILSGGNVGIGTTSPGNLLAIQGTGLFTGTLTAPNIIATGTLTLSGDTYLKNASTTGMLTIGNGFISSASSTVSSNFLVSGVLNASSSVAIAGVTSFYDRLSFGTNGYITGTAAGGFGFRVNNSANTLNLFEIYDSGGVGIGTTYAGGSSDPGVNNLIVQGNVGIGTTTPGARLSVHGDALIAGTTTVRALVATSSSLTVGGNKLVVDGSGNVGIGTAAPYSLLDITTTSVAGGALVRVGGLTDPGQATGILLGYSDSSIGTYNKVGIFYKRASIDTSQAQGELHFAVNNTADTSNATITDSKMMINKSGNVGIGTTTPNEKLVVSPTTNGGGVVIEAVGGSAAAPTLKFRTNAVSVDYRDWAMSTNLVNGSLSFTVGSAQKVDPYNATSVMQLTKDGYVGIGTTSPGALLAVQGNALVSGNLNVANITATGTITGTISGASFANATLTGSTTAQEITFNYATDMGSSTPRTNTLYKENIVKAWIAFDGAASTPTIGDAFNVSSITDNGIGDWTLTWKNAFANASQAISGSCGRNDVPAVPSAIIFSISQTTSSTTARVGCTNHDGAKDIEGLVRVMVVGDQ